MTNLHCKRLGAGLRSTAIFFASTSCFDTAAAGGRQLFAGFELEAPVCRPLLSFLSITGGLPAALLTLLSSAADATDASAFLVTFSDLASVCTADRHNSLVCLFAWCLTALSAQTGYIVP